MESASRLTLQVPRLLSGQGPSLVIRIYEKNVALADRSGRS
jgi:hypothetical protein